MKKKENKGFTLIELLAVIVILLAISVIAISSISAAIERNKNKQNESKKTVIASYGEVYYQKYKNKLKTTGCISIDDLLNSGILSQDETKDAYDNKFLGVVEYKNGTDFKYVDECKY